MSDWHHTTRYIFTITAPLAVPVLWSVHLSCRPKVNVEKAADTAVSTIGRELGRTLIRGILGSLKK